MQLKSIKIKNYKALQDIHLTELPPFLVIVGANGTGKSTLCDVFGFLRDALRVNVRQALDTRGRFHEVVTRGHETESIIFELQVTLEIAGRQRLVTYHLDIGLDGTRPVVLREFLRYKRGRLGPPSTSSTSAKEPASPSAMKRTSTSQRNLPETNRNLNRQTFWLSRASANSNASKPPAPSGCF